MRLPALLAARGTYVPRGTLAWLLQLGYTTTRLFSQSGLTNHAAATPFYFLLSASPLLLLLSYAQQLLGRIAENSVPATILMAAFYEQLQLEDVTELGFIHPLTELGSGPSAGIATPLPLNETIFGKPRSRPETDRW